jgi:predicted ATPase
MHLKQIEIKSEDFPTRRIYPFNAPAIQTTARLSFTSSIVFFVGENGSGKSTLLDAIARKSGISHWEKPRRHLAHNNPYETKLKNYLTARWANGSVSGSYFRAETFHDLADFLDDVALCDPGRLAYHGGRILNNLSHGEGMLAYFTGRLSLKGLYFLDEPESALSPASQVKFLNLLRQYSVDGRAQFIIATHSPILLACPGAQIFSFEEDCIEEVSYEETAHFKLYQQFFTDRDVFIEMEESEGAH